MALRGFGAKRQRLTTTSLLPLQQLDVGTSFIGGGDQGYIACP